MVRIQDYAAKGRAQARKQYPRVVESQAEEFHKQLRDACALVGIRAEDMDEACGLPTKRSMYNRSRAGNLNVRDLIMLTNIGVNVGAIFMALREPVAVAKRGEEPPKSPVEKAALDGLEKRWNIPAGVG